MKVAGLADHYGWVAVVVVGPDGSVVDRRRAELLEAGLPASPFHHEAQPLPDDEAVALVAEVERSAVEHAAALWDELDVDAVAIREIPRLPDTVVEQIRSYHAQTRADGAMYRRVLADAACGRGWPVHFYDHLTVEKRGLRRARHRPGGTPRGARRAVERRPAQGLRRARLVQHRNG